MRLKPIEREALTDAQRRVLEAIEQGPRGRGRPGIGMIGPFGAWVRSPGVGDAVQQLGAAIRFGSELPGNLREIAICTVGAHYQARFEFAAHRPLAEAEGVDPAQLEVLQQGGKPGFEGEEALVYAFTEELLAKHRVADDRYEEATRQLGENQVIELVATIGYYCLISLTLNAFEIPLADGMQDPFPDS